MVEELIWPAEDRLEEADASLAVHAGHCRDDKGGVTVFADMYMFMEQTARAVPFRGKRGFGQRPSGAGREIP